MRLIKLSAIDSTNDFLKELSKQDVLENFTTVVAENQTKGKGQMGAVWVSESGKNLIMSVLVKDVIKNADEVFHLNVAISVSIISVLDTLQLPNLAIKWPNDIMSDEKKVAGILIENRFKSDTTIESIVGIGLNVNQKDFTSFPKASSLALLMKKEYDIEQLLEAIVLKIKQNCELISSNSSEKLWNQYYNYLFKKDIEMSFEDADKNQFLGTILGVTSEGKLEVMLQDKTIKTFGIKEIQMQY
jgi:BirA family transcriptional regulator, biotin operon repressor / biotin---[acetyl-CoA-carboxylase] ligase